MMYCSLVVDLSAAGCPSFDPASQQWSAAAEGGVKYDASGSASSPDPSFSRRLADLMCSDPEAAATQLVEAVKAGGDQAQAAAAAVKQALQAGDCSTDPVLLAILNLVNPNLDPGSEAEVRK
ncbi:hypothetical protein ABPG75_013682 [Micractinium tetrahymenae]